MTYKEFYIWLDGYLHGKLENKHIDIAPIVEKMGEVNEEPVFDIDKWKHLSSKQISSLPITIKPDDNDEFGKPPKIVM